MRGIAGQEESPDAPVVGEPDVIGVRGSNGQPEVVAGVGGV